MNEVIFIAGLGDNLNAIQRRVGTPSQDTRYSYFSVGWKDPASTFDQKQDGLFSRIKNVDGKVALVGISAGGSFVVSTLAKQPEKITKVVNVCGRLTSEGRTFIPFGFYKNRNPLFVESVRRSEQIIKDRTGVLREKLVSLVPLFDEVVPVSSMRVDGARSIRIYSIFHALSITLALRGFNDEWSFAS